MRNVPCLGARAAVAMAEFNNNLPPPVITAIHAAPLSSPTTVKCDAQKCPWWPYTNSTDFKANTALILVILFCALICTVALNSAIRFIIRVYCCRRQDAEDPKADLGETAAEKEAEIPTMIYSAGMELKGAELECIICLSEFAIGERIRVLEKCNHGFHVQCIQRWLVSHSSCPTCRTNCASPAP